MTDTKPTDLTRWQTLWEQDETLRPTSMSYIERALRFGIPKWDAVGELASIEFGPIELHHHHAADLIHMAAIRWLLKHELVRFIVADQSPTTGAAGIEVHFMDDSHADINGPDLDDVLFRACEMVIQERRDA